MFSRRRPSFPLKRDKTSLFNNAYYDESIELIANFSEVNEIPRRRDIYEPFNRTSSRIVRVAAASRLA